MSYQGDIRLGATIEFTFTTRKFSTGAPFTLAGTPSMEAYQTGSSTPITAGITLTADYSGVTGLNHVSIAATSGNGFATAKDVSVVVAAGTVDSVPVVGETVAGFSIENRSALMPTTAARTLDISAGGEAGIDWANIGSPTTAQNLSATNIDVDQVVASVSGAVGSVTTVSDKTGYRLSATGVDDIHDEVNEGTTTFRQTQRLTNSALGAKASGLETTNAKYRDLADSKDRIDATVDADGNRSAVTLDLT